MTIHSTQNKTKEIAISLRRKGFSYSEIKNLITVPKSTLSLWLRKLKLSNSQSERLNKKRIQAGKRGVKKRILQTSKAIKEIKENSMKDIQDISKRELWLMGIILYWRENFSKEDDKELQKGVRFTNSDPYLIKLFLKWLYDIGELTKKEIKFEIFIKKDSKDVIDKAISYWSKATSFPKKHFKHIYFFRRVVLKKEKTSKRYSYGLLQVRVKASSMLARQISGWIKGMQKYYWKNTSLYR